MEINVTKKTKKWVQKIILASLLLCYHSTIVQAQIFYKRENFQPNTSYSGTLGFLFNSELYLLKNIPTIYYGPQDAYATAYLPFIFDEYNPNYPLELFGPNYTTGIAFSSIKAPQYDLYAPIEVASMWKRPNSNSLSINAYASIIPHDNNQYNYKGPFNTLVELNFPPIDYVNPASDLAGFSALSAAQKFCKFSHEIFKDDVNDPNSPGWDGFDKNGNETISITIYPGVPGDYAAADYADNQILIYQSENTYPYAKYNVMGHEIAHGIIAHTPSYGLGPFGTSRKELEEGFADIIGIAFSNYAKSGNFANPYWIALESQDYPGQISDFVSPKLYETPNAYLGQYYEDSGTMNYDVHTNGSILKYWFYLLNNYVDGYVDDYTQDESKHFITAPLFPGDKDATFKLALRILFKTFTEKLLPEDDYPAVKLKTLQVAEEMGFGQASAVYTLMKNAWFAVGLGNEPVFSNFNCNVIATAESQYNGQISFPVQEYFFDNNPNITGTELTDCSQIGEISTCQYDKVSGGNIKIMDGEKDGIFDNENNLERSKSHTSIHSFTIEARNWFKSKFNWDGIDGNANTELTNSVGDPKANTANEAYKLPDDPTSVYMAWGYDKPVSSIDYVTFRYFRAINAFSKNENYNDQLEIQTYPEWRALRAGVSRIFSLEIKNNFKAKQPVSQAPVWTFFEDAPNEQAYFDYRYPELTNKPKLYHGNNWNAEEPGLNSSLIAFWYYLLVNGTDGVQGYTNEKGKTYVIFPQDKDLVLKVIWNAYMGLPKYSTIDDFRLATHEVLQDLNYDSKSKENIAFYDAWAAVMNFPDFAASLDHYPDDDAIIDPWPAKLGVEVEYEESARLFEVSENPAFSDALATVYRFKSYMAPDQAGMTWGRVNLEPKKKYYVRSRLLETGGAHRDGSVGCETSVDPLFCSSLPLKEKWTVPYAFYTDKKEVKDLSPAKGAFAPAWKTPFSWSATPGAQGYMMVINQNGGLIPPQTFNIDKYYDEDEPKVNYTLALSKDKSYSYTLAPEKRLGSTEGVKKVVNELTQQVSYINLSDQEKANFPLSFGETSGIIAFKTDIPKVTLGTPADGIHVPMVGSLNMSVVKDEPRATHYRWELFYNENFKNPYKSEYYDIPSVTINNIASLPYLEHLHAFGWTFTPMFKSSADNPFIPQEGEAGETASPFHFIVDKNLIPSPEIIPIACAKTNYDMIYQWKEVQGAKGYHLIVKNAVTQDPIKDIITTNLFSDPVPGASVYPNTYEWSISAGVKDVNENWVWGKPTTSVYSVKPPEPTNLSPNNVSDLVLGNNHSVTFSWEGLVGITHYLLKISKLINGQMTEIAVTPVNGYNYTIPGFDYNAEYSWSIFTNEDNSSCQSFSNGSFKTQKDPAKYDMGFTLQLYDPVGPKKEIIENSFICNVQVKRPDGTIEFNENIAANSLLGGIGFEPGNDTQIGGNGAFINGQLLDQAGDYTITLKIISVFSGLTEPLAQPQIICKVQEFKKDPGEAWTLNMDIPTNPSTPKFMGRVVGSPVKLKFHYELPN